MPLPLLIPALAVSVGFLAKRVFLALGIGTLTYVGLESALSAAQSAVISNYGAMPAAALGIANLGGVGEAIGIVLGALAGRVGLVVLSKYAKIL